jgi:deazaflavin-dependent oxidoreductase (nitroreductase family)
VRQIRVIRTSREGDPNDVGEPDWNAQIVEEFRTNDGKLDGMSSGADVLLLHHAGSKTGERVKPLGYQRIGSAYVVFGSSSETASDPAWLQNLRAHPLTTVEVGTETIEVVARAAHGDEREEIWKRQKANIRRFADHEKTANRNIRIVILEPAN